MEHKQLDESLLPDSLKTSRCDRETKQASLVETIRSEAEERDQEILHRARRVAEKEKQLAKRDAREMMEQAQKEAEVLTEQKRAHHQARLRIRKHLIIEGHKELLAEQFLAELLERLGSIKRDKSYCTILARLLEQALNYLDGDSFTVRLSAADGDFLAKSGRFESILSLVKENHPKKMAISLSDQAIDTIGGLAVFQDMPSGETAEVVFHNTFEEILYRHNEDFLVFLFEALISETNHEAENYGDDE